MAENKQLATLDVRLIPKTAPSEDIADQREQSSIVDRLPAHSQTVSHHGMGIYDMTQLDRVS